MMRSVLVVAVLLAWCPVAEANPRDGHEVSLNALARAGLDLFELWNECAPIRLVVEVEETEGRIGVTREAILRTVRSRLRAARLYTQEGDPYLSVYVNTLQPVFNIRFRFNKVLFDPASSQQTFAPTWEEASIGRGDAHYILSVGVFRLTSKFIDDYLRVNKMACKGSR